MKKAIALHYERRNIFITDFFLSFHCLKRFPVLIYLDDKLLGVFCLFVCLFVFCFFGFFFFCFFVCFFVSLFCFVLFCLLLYYLYILYCSALAVCCCCCCCLCFLVSFCLFLTLVEWTVEMLMSKNGKRCLAISTN